MKIAIINGSPRPKRSVIMEYVKYLENGYPEIEFDIADVSKNIQRLEDDESRFKEVTDLIEDSDAVIWAFPIYSFLVPYQLKRYIELVQKRDHDKCFQGKHATSITTSAHLYDHTAHDFVHAVCEDMGMHYHEGFSAAPYDLFEDEKRRNLHLFFRRFMHHIKEDVETPRRFSTPGSRDSIYEPEKIIHPSPVTKEGSILLLTDSVEEDLSLKNMIETFLKKVPVRAEVQDLNDIEIKGGCLACGRCVRNGGCVYDDDLQDLIENKFMKMDGLVFAGSINGRYLSSRWKLFFDRLLGRGNRREVQKKQLGYLISGALSQNKNLESTLRAAAELGDMNLVGIVSDESKSQDRIRSNIEHLGREIAWCIEKDFSKPKMFLGVDDLKLFSNI